MSLYFHLLLYLEEAWKFILKIASIFSSIIVSRRGMVVYPVIFLLIYKNLYFLENSKSKTAI